jgi:hypothetical protein
MTDATPLYRDGVTIDVPQLPGRYIHVSRDARGRVRFTDPSASEAWVEADAAVVCEVGVDE